MIELNCSYEQSKKILDLGYDFTFICRDFELREEKEITKFVLVEKHDDGLVSLWDCGERKTCIYSTKSWWIIPIIPKAALEACLSELSGSTWLKNLRTNWMILDLDPHIIKLESIFKAFMWCHENYPEELRKKFGEVMR